MKPFWRGEHIPKRKRPDNDAVAAGVAAAMRRKETAVADGVPAARENEIDGAAGIAAARENETDGAAGVSDAFLAGVKAGQKLNATGLLDNLFYIACLGYDPDDDVPAPLSAPNLQPGPSSSWY